MNLVQPGELLLLQADTVDETVEWLRHFMADLAEKAISEETYPSMAETVSDSPTPVVETTATVPKPAQKQIHANEAKPSVLADSSAIVKA